MQLEHSFTVPVGIDDAWKVLLDIERIAPCMPGAQLETIDGDEFTGTVKVKLGPISLTYKGKAGFVEKDEAAHRATINAQGRDARGNGTASAKVTATLTDQSGETKVDVLTDLDITGKPAQFGRGVMVDVGNKLIGQFADCLAGKLSGSDDAPPAPAAAPAKSAAKKTTAASKSTATKSAPAKQAAAKKAAEPAASEPPADEPVAAEPAAEAAGAAAAAPEPAQPDAVQTEPTVPDAVQPDAVQPEAPRPGPREIVPTADVEPIDLLEHAGPAVAKRLAPVIAAVALLFVILRLRKR